MPFCCGGGGDVGLIGVGLGLFVRTSAVRITEHPNRVSERKAGLI